MTMKSAYTKSAARKTALASGIERLLHIHTYKNYAYKGGGVIAKLILLGAFCNPLMANANTAVLECDPLSLLNENDAF
ncbi:Uncharacterised protein [Anaerobiospirillum thomasii]|uniref:Uncharacterized protein n=1 Tax=Anaerobiospirillum thomasii TaxID=179995 RepID=A0A2X0V970_9GAMM|nr:Uncharacterised protein [Anaerobiospirillum thomasii]